MSEFFYDRDGKPISLDEWSELYSDRRYKLIAHTKITDMHDMSKSLVVSTVWFGRDNGLGTGDPVIFETTVFGEGSPMDMDCTRYTTIGEARKGHDVMVSVVRATLTDPVVVDALN